ncbi:hypothetical protein SUGI_0088200 [Cryptomeria japonica]|nr:hypothetical protein SUGI_0088200 [Cryptomeria japonica]
MSAATAALRSSIVVKPSTLRSAGAAVQSPVRSPGEAAMLGAAMSSASVVVAALRSSAVAKPSTLRSVGAAIQPPVRSPGEAALPGATNGGSVGVSLANTKDGDMVHPASSAVDRVSCGLGPVVVTVCKPLAFSFGAFGEAFLSCTLGFPKAGNRS